MSFDTLQHVRDDDLVLYNSGTRSWTEDKRRRGLSHTLPTPLALPNGIVTLSPASFATARNPHAAVVVVHTSSPSLRLWQPPSYHAPTGIHVRDGLKMRRPIIDLRLPPWLRVLISGRRLASKVGC